MLYLKLKKKKNPFRNKICPHAANIFPTSENKEWYKT